MELRVKLLVSMTFFNVAQPSNLSAQKNWLRVDLVSYKELVLGLATMRLR